jgi:hypothetical protein
MAVDGAQVRQVEASLDRMLSKFVRTGRRIVRFALLQDSGIADSELVSKNTGVRVKVVVFV